MTTIKRGRPVKTTGQFINVSRTPASVYVAGMSNGMVKVGFSDNSRTRLSSLNSTSMRLFGGIVVQLHVYDGVGVAAVLRTPCCTASSRARAIEARCIKILAAVGRQVAPTLEYFEGIDYASAKALIDAEIAAHIAPAAIKAEAEVAHG